MAKPVIPVDTLTQESHKRGAVERLNFQRLDWLHSVIISS